MATPGASSAAIRCWPHRVTRRTPSGFPQHAVRTPGDRGSAARDPDGVALRRPKASSRLITGCCMVAAAWLAPAATANVDPPLGLDQFSTLWTGTIHHVRTDDLSGMGAPGDFQKWDTTITTTSAKTVAEVTYTSHVTFRQSCQGSLNTYTETGTGHYKGPYRATHGRIHVLDQDGETRVFFMVPNVLVTYTTTS